MTSGPGSAPAPSGERGLFITFEGLDGVGKSTQLKLAATALEAQGHAVACTREPGGSPGAEEIRALLVSGEPGRWSPETELLLFCAARRDHVERLIQPALAKGEIVLCDRYVDSTRAYQAAGRGADPQLIEQLHALAIGLEPDLTLIFDLPAEAARARQTAGGGATAREDRFERFDAEFHARLADAFRDIAAKWPKRCAVIDASGDAAAVATRALASIEAAIAARSEPE